MSRPVPDVGPMLSGRSSGASRWTSPLPGSTLSASTKNKEPGPAWPLLYTGWMVGERSHEPGIMPEGSGGSLSLIGRRCQPERLPGTPARASGGPLPIATGRPGKGVIFEGCLEGSAFPRGFARCYGACMRHWWFTKNFRISVFTHAAGSAVCNR